MFICKRIVIDRILKNSLRLQLSETYILRDPIHRITAWIEEKIINDHSG